MEIAKYFDQQKELFIFLHAILEDKSKESDFSDLFTFLEKNKIHETRENLKDFLHLISVIAKNCHKNQDFYKKIDRIIQRYIPSIKQNFSNSEIFNIFKRNKRILLFLFDNEIIKPDNNINKYIFRKVDKNGSKYRHFFFPEISPFFSKGAFKKVQQELLTIDPQIFDNFEENRRKGENNSYICQLIRNDSIDEFIKYTAQNNISLKSKIKYSIFETNGFLLKQKETELIEYAVFYGSIQIFKYLLLNEIELKPSLWLYSIHSKSAELIHLLEEKNVQPENNVKCFEEAVKCHDNDVARYIDENFLNFEGNCFDFCFHFQNFEIFSGDLLNKNSFFYACKYDYVNLVKIFMKMNDFDINQTIVLIKKQFYNVLFFYYLMKILIMLQHCI